MSNYLSDRLREIGFSFICANCTKLHIGIKRGEKHCGHALRGRSCGGPIVELAFPEYEGPLTRQTIADICFRCGKESTRLIEVKGKGFVGACTEHIDMINKMIQVIPTKGKTA